jgi:hypothetical protein
MINNLSAYSFNNNDNLCSGSACFNIDETALTNGTLNPQTSQTRDGGYSPPPASIAYPPTEIDGEDSIVLDNYLSEGSAVSVNLSSTTTCVNLATGYDVFNFGYQLLIQNRGVVLDRTDDFTYKNDTFNITSSGSLISNWTVLSSTARYNKMLSGTSIDLLPVGSYRRTTSPNDIITLNYYLPIEFTSSYVFWLSSELINIYKTKKIVWDMFSIRLGGEDLKGDYIPFKRNETTYVVDQPRDITQYDPKELLYIDKDFSLSALQLGNSISNVGFNEMIGYSIDINDAGNRIVVGGIGGLGNDEGVVRAYELVNSSWVQMGQSLYGVDACDFFGVSVSMNYNGSRIAFGYHNQCGAVFDRRGGTKIYEWNGSQWIQLGSTIRGLIIDDDSGESIQLNSVGDRIVIAEPYGANGDGVSTIRVFEYDGLEWMQIGQTINGEMYTGTTHRVAINSIGNIIAYACEGEDSLSGANGVIRVYEWNGVQWNKTADIIDPSGTIFIGESLSINSTGDVIATSDGADAVCVFKQNEGEWNYLGNPISPLIYTGGFGHSVSLNCVGDRLAIGDILGGVNDTGIVYVYEFNGIDWRSIIEPLSGTGDNYKFFGHSTSLNKLGDRIAIGEPNDAGVDKLSRAQVYNLPVYPLLTLSAFEAYKATTLWSDGVLTEALFESPFYLPDGSYGSQSGAINFRKFTTSGEYTILYNTFYYKNSLNSERVLQEPYNITFVVS